MPRKKTETKTATGDKNNDNVVQLQRAEPEQMDDQEIVILSVKIDPVKPVITYKHWATDGTEVESKMKERSFEVEDKAQNLLPILYKEFGLDSAVWSQGYVTDVKFEHKNRAFDLTVTLEGNALTTVGTKAAKFTMKFDESFVSSQTDLFTVCRQLINVTINAVRSKKFKQLEITGVAV